MQRLARHPYIRLMRFDKPTGLWLLMWPCWWSVELAWKSQGRVGIPWHILLLFTLGASFMRAAGCIVNDIVDREIDRKVERTRTRPLASGEVTLSEAALLLFCLLWLSLTIAWMLGPLVVGLSAVWLIPIVMYPWMKRITWWPQAFLGLTFNAGALFGWLAVTGTIPIAALVLHLGAIGWTLGYDTIYAHQDKADDEKIGVKSTARLFGNRSKPWIASFYAIFIACFFVCGTMTGVRPSFFPALFLGAVHLAMQVAQVRLNDQESCRKAFQSNSLTGCILFLATLAA